MIDFNSMKKESFDDASNSALNVLDETRIRGVENPRIIDLIELDKETDVVVFSIIETRNWTNDNEQLDQLQEKLNNYLDYILDGHFLEHYPQYKDKKVCIKVESKQKPHGDSQRLVEAMGEYLKSIDMNFELAELEG